MKRIIKFGVILGLLLSSKAFSINPVQGWYFGLLGQISHAPNDSITTTTNGFTINGGNINLSPVGGGAGTSIGYKINMFRVEGEFLFNINNYGELHLGPCTLVSPNVVSPQGTCPAFIEDNGLAFNGNKMGFYGLVNAFYDFTSSDPNVRFVPYLGVGFGGALIRNHALFTNSKYAPDASISISTSVDSNNGSFALQGIVGFYYYLDDFTTMGLDYRYVSALSSNSGGTSSISQFGINTLNVTFTFALEKGEQ